MKSFFEMLKSLFGLLGALSALLVLFCPIYFAFTESPWCLFLFFVSPVGAKIISTYFDELGF